VVVFRAKKSEGTAMEDNGTMLFTAKSRPRLDREGKMVSPVTTEFYFGAEIIVLNHEFSEEK